MAETARRIIGVCLCGGLHDETTGEPDVFGIDGGEALRNFRRTCGGLVFGGEVGRNALHTIYAGSLDDPSPFNPTMAIVARDRPGWMPLPPGLALFETMPD